MSTGVYDCYVRSVHDGRPIYRGSMPACVAEARRLASDRGRWVVARLNAFDQEVVFNVYPDADDPLLSSREGERNG